jgi:hypothetical protein
MVNARKSKADVAVTDCWEDSDQADTVFGKRWGHQVIEIGDSELAALQQGKFLALDVNNEYVVYLRLERDKAGS